MDIKRVHSQKIELGRAGSIDHAIYEGSVTEEDSALAHKDPEGFLKKAKISFSPGARIHVSGDRMVGTPANEAAATAGLRIGVGVLCRVVVVVIDGYVFVFLHCIPVIVIGDPAR